MHYHFRLNRADHDAALAAGRHFYSMGGELLLDFDAVRAAKKRDEYVVSRSAP